MKKPKLVLIIMILMSIVLSSCDNKTRIKQELMMAYDTQNLIFDDVLDEITDENRNGYMPINVRNPNPEGIAYGTYIALACYRKDSGNNLTYDQAIDYLSSEYEDDGEVRIYTNGRHPEIADYIEWSNENVEMFLKYGTKLIEIWSTYIYEYKEFKTCLLSLVPTEMIDEMIKKEADAEYELDLMSIQQRWLDEGRAKVLDSGYEIEYYAVG